MSDFRYLVFGFDEFYPTGGLGDMQYSFDSLQNALDAYDLLEQEYKYVYDRIEGKIVDQKTLK